MAAGEFSADDILLREQPEDQSARIFPASADCRVSAAADADDAPGGGKSRGGARGGGLPQLAVGAAAGARRRNTNRDQHEHSSKLSPRPVHDPGSNSSIARYATTMVAFDTACMISKPASAGTCKKKNFLHCLSGVYERWYYEGRGSKFSHTMPVSSHKKQQGQPTTCA